MANYDLREVYKRTNTVQTKRFAHDLIGKVRKVLSNYSPGTEKNPASLDIKHGIISTECDKNHSDSGMTLYEMLRDPEITEDDMKHVYFSMLSPLVNAGFQIDVIEPERSAPYVLGKLKICSDKPFAPRDRNLITVAKGGIQLVAAPEFKQYLAMLKQDLTNTVNQLE